MRLAVLLALDALAILCALIAILQSGEPDVLFHLVWVVLVIEAFVYGLRVSAPRIVIAAVVVTAYSVLDAAPGVRPLEVSELLFTEWPLMFIIIATVAVMADRVTRAGRNAALLERRTHEQLMTAREDERRRLSADLHDGLGQTLTALVLTLDAAEASLPGAGATPSPSHDALRRAQEIAAIALEETRDVTRRLRPARMRELGLANAIRELAANAGRPVSVDFDPRLASPDLLPVDEEMQVYRIVQEAVANAVRHAAAPSISVDMQVVRGTRLQIEIVDDGAGFDPSRGHGDGLGLRGMRERAAAIRATLAVDSRPGVGTRVRLLLPLPQEPSLVPH